MQRPDHFPIEFRNNQFMVWVGIDLLERHRVRLGQGIFISFALTAQIILRKQNEQ